MSLPGGDDAKPWKLERYGSLNVREPRTALQADKDGNEPFSWIENWMPIGDGNLRTLPDAGAALYAAPSGKTIIYAFAYNLDDPVSFVTTYYFAIFLSDGSAYQVNAQTGASTLIGTGFWTAGMASLPSCAQWESTYLVISSTVATNAYWLWNGTSLFGAGTLAPEVTVTNGGQSYTTAPTIAAYGGAGAGAIFVGAVENGAVSTVRVTNPGAGYVLNDQPQLSFTGGGTDTQATATAGVNASSAGVSAILVINGGSNFGADSGLPVLAITGGGGTGANGAITGISVGAITAITVTNPGQGYTGPPTVSATGAGGQNAVLQADTRSGQITSITVDSGGTNYVSPPQVVISPPDLETSPSLQATAIATVASGKLTGFTITNPGYGYSKATVQLVGGNKAASATTALMPFGSSGDSLETYEDRVWLADGTHMSYTGADSTSDFGSTTGGGSDQATDNFLRRKIVRLVAANGFLYRFGDSSINVISNVQTSGTPATTSYSNSNVDPQVGTPYRDSVQVFGRAIVFANQVGVYALYGGAAEKVSDELDPLFQKADFTGPPTACVVTLFGKSVYVLQLLTTDPYTKTKRTILLMWDGKKWWVGSQSKAISFVLTQPIDSVQHAWGSDGNTLFPLFTTPSSSLAKTIQTRLGDEPATFFLKQVEKVYATTQNNSTDTPNLNIGLDTETGLGLTKALTMSPGLNLPLYAPQVDNRSKYGRLIGATITTQAQDLTLVSATILLNPRYGTKV